MNEKKLGMGNSLMRLHRDIVYPFYGQSTAVKTEYPLTSINDRITGSGVYPLRLRVFADNHFSADCRLRPKFPQRAIS